MYVLKRKNGEAVLINHTVGSETLAYEIKVEIMHGVAKLVFNAGPSVLISRAEKPKEHAVLLGADTVIDMKKMD